MENKENYRQSYIDRKDLLVFHNLMKSGKSYSEYFNEIDGRRPNLSTLDKLDDEFIDKLFWLAKPILSFIDRRIVVHFIPNCEKYIKEYEARWGTGDYPPQGRDYCEDDNDYYY